MSRPPQVRVRFFPPMIPDLAGSGRRIYSLVSVPHRASPSPAGSPHSTAHYPLLVHRHGILPRPSFGPHLAVGTLVSANGSCGQARKGLSPSRFAPCWAHRKWVFCTKCRTLLFASDIKIVRHGMVRNKMNPYIDTEYYTSRQKNRKHERGYRDKDIAM